MYYKSGLQPFFYVSLETFTLSRDCGCGTESFLSNSAGAKCTAAPEAVGLPAHFKRSPPQSFENEMAHRVPAFTFQMMLPELFIAASDLLRHSPKAAGTLSLFAVA